MRQSSKFLNDIAPIVLSPLCNVLAPQPISGPSVVVHVGEEEEPPQVNGGESSRVSKSSLRIFILSFFVILLSSIPQGSDCLI